MLGIMLADMFLFAIPSLLFVIFTLIFDLDLFLRYPGHLTFTLLAFGFSFINLSNVIGFAFKSVNSAYLSATIFMLLIGLGLPIIGLLLIWVAGKGHPDWENTVNWIMLIVSPFFSLRSNLFIILNQTTVNRNTGL